MLECSLHPYDVLECEPEIVSGYYVDHGAVAFMLIYLSEGVAMMVMQSACLHHHSVLVATQWEHSTCCPSPTPCPSAVDDVQHSRHCSTGCCDACCAVERERE